MHKITQNFELLRVKIFIKRSKVEVLALNKKSSVQIERHG